MQACFQSSILKKGRTSINAVRSSSAFAQAPSVAPALSWRVQQPLPFLTSQLKPAVLKPDNSAVHTDLPSSSHPSSTMLNDLSQRTHKAPAPRVLTSDFLSGSLAAEQTGSSPQQSEQQQQAPSQERRPKRIPKSHTYLILLNWTLSKRLPEFWDKAGTCICADGGSNRLHDELPAMLPDQDPQSVRKRFLPSVIKGDLDSIRPEVLAFYKSHNVPIVDSSADQDTTDLTKCIAYVEQHLQLEEQQLQQEHHVSPLICVEAAAADQRRYEQLNHIKHQEPCSTTTTTTNSSSPQASHQPALQPRQLEHRRSSQRQQLHKEQQHSGAGLAGSGAQGGPLGNGVCYDGQNGQNGHAHNTVGDGACGLQPVGSRDTVGEPDEVAEAGLGHASIQATLREHDHQIMVLGALGGRLDHTIAAINTLHMFPDLNIILFGDGNMVRLLPRGRSVIKPDRRVEGPMCGLIPMKGPAIASTTGLRWNVDNTEMAFGGLVSTSNRIVADEVDVTSDTELVWTVEFRED